MYRGAQNPGAQRMVVRRKRVVGCDKNVIAMPGTVAAAMHGRKEDLPVGG